MNKADLKLLKKINRRTKTTTAKTMTRKHKGKPNDNDKYDCV